MRLDLEDHGDDSGINLTPMIDIVFLLLIFFLAATTFARHEVEMDLKLPESGSGRPAELVHPLVISVLADGRIVLDGREVGFEALRQRLEAAAQRSRDQSVLVRGDRAAPFGAGIQVLDACRSARLTKVDFAALPKDG